MNKNILNKWFLGFFLITSILAGCKAKKAVVVNKPVPEVKNTNKLLLDLQNKQLNFTTFTTKAKAKLAFNGNENDVTLNFRIKKDQKIWVSVTYIGLEIARALITPDSIKILNRVKAEYTAKPFNYVYKYANKEVNYSMLEAILVGNSIPAFLNSTAILTTQNNLFVLNGSKNTIKYQLNYNGLKELNQTSLKDETANQELLINYSNFGPVGEASLPFNINLKSKANTNSVIASMQYGAIQINENLDFPFTVPKRYETVN